MYHISIGDYKVNSGETLPTKDLSDDYEILWNTERGRLYTVVLLDEGFANADRGGGSYVHLLLTNVENGRSNVVANYVPLLEDLKPHVYSAYLLEQSCRLYPDLSDRRNFDLKGMLTREAQRGCPLYLVDKVTFYGVSDPYAKPDIFAERYDTAKFNEEDYQILGESVYGIPNARELTSPEIVEKINKILLYRGTS